MPRSHAALMWHVSADATPRTRTRGRWRKAGAELAQLKAAFDRVDVDGDGALSAGELVKIATESGVATSKAEAEAAIRALMVGRKPPTLDFDGFARCFGVGGGAVEGASDADSAALSGFKRAVLLSSLGIDGGEEGADAAQMVLQVLRTPRRERLGWAMQGLELYVEQLKLEFFQQTSPSPELRAAICAALDAVALEPQETLYGADDAADAYYIVVEGEVEEVAVDKEGEVTVLRTLRAGAAFGESALAAAPARRKQGVRGGYKYTDTTTLARLGREDYLRLLAEERARECEVARGFLEGLHLLRRMPKDAMTQLAAAVEPVQFGRHAVLATQGARPEHLLLLRSGDAVMTVVPSEGRASEAPEGRPRSVSGRRPDEVSVASLALAGEIVGAGFLADSAYSSYTFPCSIVATNAVAGYRVHRDLAKRCFRSRAVTRALLSSHATREELTMQLISGGDAGAEPAVDSISSRAKVEVPEREQCVPPAFVVPNSLDGKALRVKHLPQAPDMTTSMLLSHSTSFSSLDVAKPGSRGGGRGTARRPLSAASASSTATSASDMIRMRRRRKTDAEAKSAGGGAGGAAHHACAFRVINDFVARSDGVLQQGSVTRIAGFSVAHDSVTVAVRGNLDRRPSTAGGGQDESWAPEEVWKAQALGSGLWEVHVEQPRFDAPSYTITARSEQTAGTATFAGIRWGDVAAGLGMDGLEVHSRLDSLRYPSQELPVGAVALEREARRAAAAKESSLGALEGMVTNLPQIPPKPKQKREASSEKALRMLQIKCAGNNLGEEASTEAAQQTKVYGRFCLDAYLSAG